MNINKILIFNSVFNNIVDPTFRLMRFPLDGELDFIWKWFYLLENDLVAKQNKKENRDFLFWKRWSVKKSDRVWGLDYLSGRYGENCNTPLSF